MIRTKIGDFSLEVKKYKKGTCIFIVKKSYGMRVMEQEITIDRPCPKNHVWLAQTGPNMLMLRRLEKSGCIQRLKGDKNLIVKDQIAYRLSRFIGEASQHFEDEDLASKYLGIKIMNQDVPIVEEVKEKTIVVNPVKEETVEKEEEVVQVEEEKKVPTKEEVKAPKVTSAFFKRLTDILDEDEDDD